MSEDPKKTVSRESDKFMLRFPEGMRDRVATAADRNGRSMNSEILARLAYTFEKDAEDWIDGARDIVGAGKYDKIADLIIQRLNGEQLLVTRKMAKYDGPKKAVIPFRIAEEDQSPPGAELKSTGAKRTRKPKD